MFTSRRLHSASSELRWPGQLASIDIGSNSFRLEIGQIHGSRYRRVDYLKETVRLGAGLDLALTTLPAELRACWVLKELHHLSYPEIAYAIGVPVATVRGRIARARLHLAKGMSEWR